ncbi:MAG: OmpA family protein [Bacteroidetes bacterium]|nr:OmpA family protein [Bacteroidota bacterium]
MKKVVLFLVLLNVLSLFVYAQDRFPNPIPFKTIDYLDKSKVKQVYNASKSEKKGFLFFDMVSEPLAEVMFNGANFVFTEKNITIFPIYFSGQLTKKTSDDIISKVPTQIVRSPETSIFKDFKLTNEDFPVLIVYNEKNELCGFSRNVQNIAEIDCGLEMVQFKVLRLKIMTEEKDNTMKPYAFKPVVILSLKNNDTIAKLTTNKYGDFNAEIPDLDQDYLITVDEKNKDINFAVLATQTGKLVGKFKATDKGFEYKLLSVELSKLPDIAVEEDVEMKFTTLKQKALNNFDITETLYYELGESELTQSSKSLLTKVKKVMDTYPEFKLLVISHTDSQGDDEGNLKLSIKRSETVISYLSSIGIKMDRLKAAGKGEMEIRNRCTNGVDCSDKEHEYNRRTEFKFSRN